MLFINTGTLGDVVISSLILEYDDRITGYEKIYFLVKEEFSGILDNYKGRVNIIKWKRKEYKLNIFARLKFLRYLHSLNLKTTYNLTSARGITCDELALLSGAGEKYCLNKNYLYLKKYFGQKTDRLYDEVLYDDVLNEYEKYINLIKILTGNKDVYVLKNHSKTYPGDAEVPEIREGKYVVVSPFAGDIKRSYGVNNFRTICTKLSDKFKIVILGTEREKEISEGITGGIKNVINLTGKLHLKDLPAVIKNAEFYIGNDSGLTHIALRMNTPLVAIIGGGNYGRYLPYMESAQRKYLFHQMECFGCQWKCIYKERHCITDLEIETVIDTINKLEYENS